MDRSPRRWLKARIAVSAVCLVISVLLCVLWVRSYRHAEVLHIRTPYWPTAFGSVQGGLTMFRSGMRPTRFDGPWLLTGEIVGERVQDYWAEVPPYRNALGFGILQQPGFRVYSAPHWFPVVLFLSLAVITWIPWRFSLKTLLIVTTLLATVLGLVVYMSSSH